MRIEERIRAAMMSRLMVIRRMGLGGKDNGLVSHGVGQCTGQEANDDFSGQAVAFS